MRPAFVAILFLLVGLALLAFSYRGADRPGGMSAVSRRVRRRTAAMFALIAVGLLILDLLT